MARNGARGDRGGGIDRGGAVAPAGGGNVDDLDGGNNADAVNCGAGRDVAFVDPADRLRGCEAVNRGR